jgi:hypothetical protein
MRNHALAATGLVIAGMSLLTGTAVAKEYELSLWTQFSPKPAMESEFDLLLLELGDLERELRLLQRLGTEIPSV